MPDLTPIKVRGKRKAAAEEKWHARKLPRTSRDTSPASSVQSSSRHSTPAPSSLKPKRKKPRKTLSRLEQLPTEILQQIFEAADNPDLPSASRQLLAQLSSSHVYNTVTDHILAPVLGYETGRASDASLLAATRLCNSRFFTLAFFNSWLEARLTAEENTLPVPQRGGPPFHKLAWASLHPSPGLMPPQKLLAGEWTDEKMQFLSMFTLTVKDIYASGYAELAQDGLSSAVAGGHRAAMKVLLQLGARTSTELLRQAVIDNDCDGEMIDAIMEACTQRFERSGSDADHRQSDIDFFDPALWSWADRAQSTGKIEAFWLINLLKANAWRVNGAASTLATEKLHRTL